MNTFEYTENGTLVKVHSSFSYAAEDLQSVRVRGNFIRNRNDFLDIVTAENVAQAATELTGELYIATDQGLHVSPRFDVIRAPKVGDKVSCSFNGDSYPCGIITRISPTLKKVTTSDGSEFYRVHTSGTWLKNSCWSLTQGHVDERNLSF